MKTVSKKFLQKLANKFDCEIVGIPNFIYIYDRSDDTHLGSILNKVCPELAKGEVIKPQEKWKYPVADHVPECGFVWFGYCGNWWMRIRKIDDNLSTLFTYVLPDPNNPDKPPKKNWRPK